MATEDERTIYQQEWENLRFQDKLRWSRYQTVAVIEGAFLLAGYQDSLPEHYKLIITTFGSILVLVYTLLAVKDGFDAKGHAQRLELVSDKLGVPKWAGKKLPFGLTGDFLMESAVFLINAFNILVLVDRIKHVYN